MKWGFFCILLLVSVDICISLWGGVKMGQIGDRMASSDQQQIELLERILVAVTEEMMLHDEITWTLGTTPRKTIVITNYRAKGHESESETEFEARHVARLAAAEARIAARIANQ